MAFEFSEEYKRYIKSPQWKMVCKRYWAAYGRKCQACASRKNLHVHHKSYDRFGREMLADLAGVCDSCHRAIHAAHRANRKVSLRLVTDRFITAKRISSKRL